MTLATGGRRMSRAEVIERARGIAAAVAPQVARAEQLRRMPPENVTAMMGSGLMPLMRPARFGGFGGDWLDLLNACTEVGRVCGSTAWCLSFLLHHQWIFCLFPRRRAKTRLRVRARSEIRRLLRASRQGALGRRRLGAERGMALGLGRRSL